jgi:transposase
MVTGLHRTQPAQAPSRLYGLARPAQQHRLIPTKPIRDTQYGQQLVSIACRPAVQVSPRYSYELLENTADGKGRRSKNRYRRRWKVERPFAWMHNFRYLVTRGKYHTENFFGFVHLACTFSLGISELKAGHSRVPPIHGAANQADTSSRLGWQTIEGTNSAYRSPPFPFFSLIPRFSSEPALRAARLPRQIPGGSAIYG